MDVVFWSWKEPDCLKQVGPEPAASVTAGSGVLTVKLNLLTQRNLSQ